jgi:hypothetical protein
MSGVDISCVNKLSSTVIVLHSVTVGSRRSTPRTSSDHPSPNSASFIRPKERLRRFHKLSVPQWLYPSKAAVDNRQLTYFTVPTHFLNCYQLISLI